MHNLYKKIILERIPVIDVRAPIEFKEGSIPGSVNLPIMNDGERALVGTAYKKQGREAAIELAHKLVDGDVKKTRIQSWLNFIQEHPNAIIMCFRGGLRSKTAQIWLHEADVEQTRLEDGYKGFRNFLIQTINNFAENFSSDPELLKKFIVISGATGAGKTDLLREIKDGEMFEKFRNKFHILDLEKMANHRGSAFGGFETPQPAQADFENVLATELIRIKNRYTLVEDESRLIGNRALPNSFFELIRKSAIIFLDESFDVRQENTLQEYVIRSGKNFEKYKSSVKRISKKLGGLRTQELLDNITLAEQSDELDLNRVWIAKLLNWYYDPMYFNSLETRQPKILYQGPKQKVLEYLSSLPQIK